MFVTLKTCFLCDKYPPNANCEVQKPNPVQVVISDVLIGYLTDSSSIIHDCKQYNVEAVIGVVYVSVPLRSLCYLQPRNSGCIFHGLRSRGYKHHLCLRRCDGSIIFLGETHKRACFLLCLHCVEV